MIAQRWWACCGLLLFLAPAQAALQCQPARPVSIRVRMAESGARPVEAWLQGGAGPALSIITAEGSRRLWSASASLPASQRFPDMRAAFGGSLIAIDLDDDGLHDRIYAGDLAGRAWRFDLHQGAAAAEWATGGVFADFSTPPGRAFVAAPDVSLSAPAGQTAWFNIAMGTASPASSTASNRYYVLRDHAPFEIWTAAEYAGWAPLREADLLQLTQPLSVPDQEIEDGYFIEIARGELLMPSVTVSGHTVVAVAESAASADSGCRVVVSIGELEIESATSPAGSDAGAATRDWRIRQPLPVPADAHFTLTSTEPQTAVCTLGDLEIAGCSLDMRPARKWWRREDAE